MKNNPTDNWMKALLPQAVFRRELELYETSAERMLPDYFLQDVQDSLAGEISYGQQKLLTIACCIANGATLLLLDEPVAGIQPEYRNKMTSLISALKEQGKTIFLIEHNTDFITDIADKIFFLHEGIITTYENMALLRMNLINTEAFF